MALKYKEGDRVRIKSIDWYYKNRDRIDEVACGNTIFVPEMVEYCEKIVTISSVLPTLKVYRIKEDGGMFNWTDEMFEELVEEETKPKFKVGDKIKLKSTLLTDIFGVIGYEPEGYRITNISNGLTYFMSYSIEHYYELVEEENKPKYEDEVNGEYYSTPKYLVRPSGYQFKDENGNVINAKKIVLEKKKKEYPKTYEECCTVLRFHYDHYLTYDDEKDINPTKEEEEFIDLMDAFSRLVVCRNAYWKIAGEEMGLGKPWKPSKDKMVYSFYRHSNEIETNIFSGESVTFEFPTEEIRDKFYENFKDLIENCKELL